MNLKQCPTHGHYSGGFDACPYCPKSSQNKPKAAKARKPKRSHKKSRKTALERKYELDMKFGRLSKGEKLTYDFLSIIEQREKSLLSTMKPEHMFDERAISRKWRVDFVILDLRIAIELEGGVWTNGRHTRGSGFIEDCNKYNQLALQGWLLLRYTREHIDNEANQVMAEIRNAIRVRKEFNKLLDVA